jgi:hypothetical protein
MNKDLIPAIKESLQIDLPENIPLEALKEKLSVYINELILSDFQKLVSILYRVDVSEIKLKTLLKENPGNDAGRIIAELIIERQLQKIKSREEYRRDSTISDDEKW